MGSGRSGVKFSTQQIIAGTRSREGLFLSEIPSCTNRGLSFRGGGEGLPGTWRPQTMMWASEFRDAAALRCMRGPTPREKSRFAWHRPKERTAAPQFSGGPAFVTMVEAANLRKRHDPTHLGSLYRSRLRRILREREVSSGLMIIGYECLQVAVQ